MPEVNLSPVPLPERPERGFVEASEYWAGVARLLADRCEGSWMGEQRAYVYKSFAALIADTVRDVVPAGGEPDGDFSERETFAQRETEALGKVARTD